YSSSTSAPAAAPAGAFASVRRNASPAFARQPAIVVVSAGFAPASGAGAGADCDGPSLGGAGRCGASCPCAATPHMATAATAKHVDMAFFIMHLPVRL